MTAAVAETRQRFEAALDAVIEDVQRDEHILAAILCGSLAYDDVWDKSDIDLALICTDDKKTKTHGVVLTAEDVNIHATVHPRAEFRRELEASVRNTFEHSLYAKGRLIFSRDPSIDALFGKLGEIGARDSQLQAMASAQHALATLYKARKWHAIKDDPNYTALWVLNTARALGEVVVGLAGEIVDREALLAARRHEPKLFALIYSDLLERKVTPEALTAALDAIDDYLEQRAETLFEPLIDYLRATGGEPRSTTEIVHFARRHFGSEHVVLACEWLADIGLIERASTAVKLTTRSQTEVDELAFFRIAW